MTVDDMFTKGGLTVFLTTGESGSGRYSNGPRLPVYLGDYPRPVYLTSDDIRCPECSDYHNPPDDKPAKWLAANKALNDGLCAACDP